MFTLCCRNGSIGLTWVWSAYASAPEKLWWSWWAWNRRWPYNLRQQHIYAQVRCQNVVLRKQVRCNCFNGMSSQGRFYQKGLVSLSLDLKIQWGVQQTVVRIESLAGTWSVRQMFVNSFCLHYSWNSHNQISCCNARVYQRVSMNLNMTVGHDACRLKCRPTLSALAASCVGWPEPIVTCESGERTCGCSCLKRT